MISFRSAFIPLLTIPAILSATPISLVNPGVEINNGINGTALSDPAILGWDGTGSLSEGSTDYGNGRWKITFEDSQSFYQLTNHPIQTGDFYSIRFDAALSSSSVQGDGLIGGATGNGDFNADTSATSSRTFSNTPDWTNLGGLQSVEATKTDLDFAATRNAVIKQSPTAPTVHAHDSGHTLVTNDILTVSFV